jgi:hypothetical protein
MYVRACTAVSLARSTRASTCRRGKSENVYSHDMNKKHHVLKRESSYLLSWCEDVASTLAVLQKLCSVSAQRRTCVSTVSHAKMNILAESST